mmetsp:Transcript_30328/g.66513  ORF Transcript_30328/g.66513 Transcript_30328/m.66513 type:complete len:419 (-) Transcript_30328:464-1720(-)
MPFGLLARVAKTHPFKFGCIFSCAKTSFSDWLVQTAIEKREQIDWRRNSTFALFGLVYLGGIQYALYVPVFGRLFPTAAAFAAAPLSAKLSDFTGIRRMLSQVFLDQFVHHPIMYFPAFYSLKEVVNGGTPQMGIEKYRKNCTEDLLALWKLWVPSMIINFTFMPMYGRIPWVATTSLLWTCILSYMRGGAETFETNPGIAEDYSGNQGRMLQRAMSLQPANDKHSYYDASKTHLLLNVTGHDRVGYVSQLTEAVSSRGGDVLDARMYKLGGQFIVNMLVAMDHGVAPSMIADLTNMDGMQVGVQHCEPYKESEVSADKAPVLFTAQLHVTGPDRAGIIKRLSSVCKEHGVDVNTLSCALLGEEKQDGTKQKYCNIAGILRAAEPDGLVQLKAHLAEVEKELGLTMRLDIDSQRQRGA